MKGEQAEKYMLRCLELAGRAEGMTYPNPMVGAVVVHNDIIIGEGYHIRAGGPHAEVIAIDSVTDKELIPESTLYVSLEPCSHFGKTPPCTDLIIRSQIPKIVVGTTDTSLKVSGDGIRKLREAGREVITGMLDEECRRINRRFFTFHEKKRPYITLKWAQSSDGFIDIVRTDESPAGPHWISGKPERVLVHKWRSEEQAILVGAGTVRNDNPSLNVRYWSGTDPVKVILSKSGDIGKYLTLNETNGTKIVFSELPGESIGNGVTVKLLKDIPSAFQVTDYLYSEGIQSLLIEGGAGILNHFIDTGMWDEARIFSGRTDFNNGIKAPEISGILNSWSEFESTRLETLINDHN
jgi:diaminohydroxyphosphoribosylaminopyrimidine deaminase / 5-amino-6-(5-phosphoribosylamino)uracil reductase